MLTPFLINYLTIKIQVLQEILMLYTTLVPHYRLMLYLETTTVIIYFTNSYLFVKENTSTSREAFFNLVI